MSCPENKKVNCSSPKIEDASGEFQKEVSTKDLEADKAYEADGTRGPRFRFFNEGIQLIIAIGSSAVVFLFIGYLIGWIRAKSYYQIFGASWITHQLKPSVLLSLSALPVGLFALLIIIRFMNFSRSKSSYKKLEKLEKIFVLTGVAIFILFTIIDFYALQTDIYSKYRWLNCLGFLLYFTLYLFAAALANRICSLILLYRDNVLNWYSIISDTLYFVFFLGIFIVTGNIGRFEAYRDSDILRTTLPQVVLKETPKQKWHLLMANNDIFYITKLPTATGSAEFRVIHAEQLSSIIGQRTFTKKAKENKKPLIPKPLKHTNSHAK